MPPLRMAVIGVGHLGQAHARVLAGMEGVELVGVADVSAAQARQVADRHNTRAYTHYGPLLDQADAACIVVPTCHHHSVATSFLERGIPLLIEKPIAPTVEQAEDLVNIARRKGVVLQVGHIERFNPAFEALCGRPIRPKFVECERHGPFTGRSTDIGAVLDLMVHDLDLLHALDGSAVVDVEAMGITVFGGQEDLVNARLRFASGCVAHVTASRISATPKRRLRIWAPEGYAGIDFMHGRLALVQPSEELRRHGLTVANLDPARRGALKDEIFTRYLVAEEQVCSAAEDQLTRELRHFVDCVRTGSRPRVSGEDGLAAVTLATRVLTSLRQHQWEGRPDGPTGPSNMPAPSGRLIDRDGRAAA
jgi:predicted dehydrogenase